MLLKYFENDEMSIKTYTQVSNKYFKSLKQPKLLKHNILGDAESRI